MKKIFYLLPFILIACENSEVKKEEAVNENIEEVVESEEQSHDGTFNVDSMVKEEASEVIQQAEDYTETAKKVGENVVEGKKEQEVKMESVTFCDCVKQQNSIDTRMDDAEEDAEIEALMEEMDELSKGPCKDLLNETQTTPEQREERKQRIAKCLEG